MKDWVGRVPGVLAFYELWTPGHERLGMQGYPVFWLFTSCGPQGTKDWVGRVPGVSSIMDQWTPGYERLGRDGKIYPK